jgi:adenosine deaminase
MLDLKTMPKAELHRHLELCVRPSTIRELAPGAGITIKDDKDFADRFLITEPMNDLGSVLNKFLDTQKLLSSAEILERLAFETCEDAFVREGIRILELRYSLTFTQMGHGLSFEEIHAAYLKGIQRAEAKFPMAVGFLCTFQRTLPVKDAENVVDFVIDHKDSFVGVDLADNEVGFDSKPFSEIFHRAKKAGLGITIHSGEANVEKAPRYVRDAIDYLGAERIGHGVQIYRSEEMMNYVKEKQVVLELCPTSNYLTNAVPSKADHPLKRLFDFGVLTTINTDDPGIFDIDLNVEYAFARDLLKFSDADLQRCTQIAAERSFIPLAKRQKVWPTKLV